MTHTTRPQSAARRTGAAAVVAAGPTFFATLDAWRAWLAKNHDKQSELSVGFWKRGTGKPSITWPESVDGALAFGWIDGVRHRVDDDRYRIRFTPRKPGSNWSQVNIRRVEELDALGLMHPAGLAAFETRDEKGAVYSYEQRKAAVLPPEMQTRLEKDRKAFAYFSARPPGYQRVARYWVTSAKQEATREKRFLVLLACSREGRPIPSQVPRTGKEKG